MLGENVSYIQLNFRAKSKQSLVNIIDKIRTFFKMSLMSDEAECVHRHV